MTAGQKTPPNKGQPPTGREQSTPASEALSAKLQQLATKSEEAPMRLGARLRNDFLAGVIIVGPIVATIYIVLWVIEFADERIKPLIPEAYLPETYLPFAIPGIGILFAALGLILIGALAANLIGRSVISYGEMLLDRMPVVRNLYRALKQIFESAVTAAGPMKAFQKVGLIEFPSKGLWSLVFITGEAGGEIAAIKPGGEEDLISVFMPTGIVPPTGFICFVPRRDVLFLKMSAEDAAKIVISAGMVTPDYQARLRQLAEKEKLKAARTAGTGPSKRRKRKVQHKAPEEAK